MKRTFRPPKPSGPRCLGGSLEARLGQPPTPTCWEPTAPCSVHAAPRGLGPAPASSPCARRPRDCAQSYVESWRPLSHPRLLGPLLRLHARRSCISSPLGLAEAAGRTAGALCPLDPHSSSHEPPQDLHQAEVFACQGMRCQGRQTSRPPRSSRCTRRPLETFPLALPGIPATHSPTAKARGAGKERRAAEEFAKRAGKNEQGGPGPALLPLSHCRARRFGNPLRSPSPAPTNLCHTLSCRAGGLSCFSPRSPVQLSYWVSSDPPGLGP